MNYERVWVIAWGDIRPARGNNKFQVSRITSHEHDGRVISLKAGRAVASYMFRQSRNGLDVTQWSQMTAVCSNEAPP